MRGASASVIGSLVSLAVLASGAPARAAGGGSARDGGARATASAREADELARSIAEEAEALSTDDCAAACKALASMRRAADRLCALEAGPRCEDARAKVEGASARVRGACPACAMAAPPPEPQTRPQKRPQPQAQPQPQPQARPQADAVQEATASAPPSERRGGGCAGCAAVPTGEAPGRSAWSVLIHLVAAAALLRRRARRQEPRTSRTATLPPRT